MFQSLSSKIITIYRFSHRSQYLLVIYSSVHSYTNYTNIVGILVVEIFTVCKKITWNFAQQHNLLCFFTSRVFYYMCVLYERTTLPVEPCVMFALWLKLDTNFCFYTKTRQKNRIQQTNNCQPLPRVFSL